MKFFYVLTLSLLLQSCRCQNKEKVLQQRQDNINKITAKYGNIIPPATNEIPDISECIKK